MREPGATGVDMVFALEGTRLPSDHADALARAVAGWLPWLADEPAAGIHPLKTAPTGNGEVLLARRARLLLRVPGHRAQASLALAGRSLDVGEGLSTGRGAMRELVPSSTLYADRVASDAPDERGFQDEVAGWLAQAGVRCAFISGRARRFAPVGRTLRAFGLALHGLSPEESIRVQSEGFGPHRTLGCGIFVPHKAISLQDGSERSRAP